MNDVTTEKPRVLEELPHDVAGTLSTSSSSSLSETEVSLCRFPHQSTNETIDWRHQNDSISNDPAEGPTNTTNGGANTEEEVEEEELFRREELKGFTFLYKAMMLLQNSNQKAVDPDSSASLLPSQEVKSNNTSKATKPGKNIKEPECGEFSHNESTISSHKNYGDQRDIMSDSSRECSTHCGSVVNVSAATPTANPMERVLLQPSKNLGLNKFHQVNVKPDAALSSSFHSSEQLVPPLCTSGGGGGSGSSSSTNASQGDHQHQDDDPRFRPYQSDQWTDRFEELCQYRQKFGNCLVPHTYTESPPLARWVKRQRYQYKLLKEGKSSTMSEERVKVLEDIGFIWDSQGAAWEERLGELTEFRAQNKHCNVPTNFRDNPQLASWVKCQRRQYKLYLEGQPSNITPRRIERLEELGFEWELRPSKKRKQTCNDNHEQEGVLPSIPVSPSSGPEESSSPEEEEESSS